MGKTLNSGYKITTNIWTKTINNGTMGIRPTAQGLSGKYGTKTRSLTSKYGDPHWKKKTWIPHKHKGIATVPKQKMSSSTMILQTPCLGRLPSRSNQLSRTYVVQVSNIRRQVLHVSDASSRPTTKHLWPSKCVVQGKSIYAKYSTFITPDTRGLCHVVPGL